MDAEVAESEVVGDDDDDVGFGCGLGVDSEADGE
jgi:hypothetical protein